LGVVVVVVVVSKYSFFISTKVINSTCIIATVRMSLVRYEVYYFVISVCITFKSNFLFSYPSR